MKNQIEKLIKLQQDDLSVVNEHIADVDEKRKALPNTCDNVRAHDDLRTKAVHYKQLRRTHESFILQLQGLLSSQPKLIDLDRTDAIKVKFKGPIFEDDFPDAGMVAWLTAIHEYHADGQAVHYELFFDFTDFEEQNEKFMRRTYYANSVTSDTGTDELFTAREAGYYNNKYSVYFGDLRNPDFDNEAELAKCLEIVDE